MPNQEHADTSFQSELPLKQPVDTCLEKPEDQLRVDMDRMLYHKIYGEGSNGQPLTSEEIDTHIAESLQRVRENILAIVTMGNGATVDTILRLKDAYRTDENRRG